MRKWLGGWIWISVIILFISGCSEDQQSNKEPALAVAITATPDISPTASAGIEDPKAEKVLYSSDPEAIKAFLSAQKILTEISIYRIIRFISISWV